jgi:hypothetical protein
MRRGISIACKSSFPGSARMPGRLRSRRSVRINGSSLLSGRPRSPGCREECQPQRYRTPTLLDHLMVEDRLAGRLAQGPNDPATTRLHLRMAAGGFDPAGYWQGYGPTHRRARFSDLSPCDVPPDRPHGSVATESSAHAQIARCGPPPADPIVGTERPGAGAADLARLDRRLREGRWDVPWRLHPGSLHRAW